MGVKSIDLEYLSLPLTLYRIQIYTVNLICVYVCMSVYVCICVYMCMCVYVFMCVHVFVSVYVFYCERMCVFPHAYLCVLVYLQTFVVYVITGLRCLCKKCACALYIILLTLVVLVRIIQLHVKLSLYWSSLKPNEPVDLNNMAGELPHPATRN